MYNDHKANYLQIATNTEMSEIVCREVGEGRGGGGGIHSLAEGMKMLLEKKKSHFLSRVDRNIHLIKMINTNQS